MTFFLTKWRKKGSWLTPLKQGAICWLKSYSLIKIRSMREGESIPQNIHIWVISNLKKITQIKVHSGALPSHIPCCCKNSDMQITTIINLSPNILYHFYTRKTKSILHINLPEILNCFGRRHRRFWASIFNGWIRKCICKEN